LNVIKLDTNKKNLQNALYNYWVFENAVNEEICQDIIDLGKDKWQKAKIQNEKSLDTKVRRTDVAWSNDDWLYNLCWDYLHTANKNANWNFEISSCENMQITKYKKNGHYDFHQDGNGFTKFENGNKFTHGKTRKLSMSIVLNDDFEGGEFEFFGNEKINSKRGTVIVFPSYKLHRVKPVTEGTRYSLVTWFCGESFR